MNFTQKLIGAAFAVLLLGTLNPASAQQMTLDVNGGASQPIGSNYDDWETGYSLGASGFIWVAERFAIGGRFGYSKWTPNESSFSEAVEDLLNIDVSGSTTILEILPSVRIRTAYEDSPLNFFGQAGLGLYMIKTETSIKGELVGVPVETVFDDGDWIGRFGASLGAGISIGSARSFTIDIFPLYNLVNAGSDESAFQYFTANVGLSFHI